MWIKRLVIVLVAAALLSAASVTTGLSTAQAVPRDLYKVADDVATFLARKFGMSAADIQPQFVAQTTKWTPVADDAQLLAVKRAWETYAPPEPRPGKIAPVRGRVPAKYSRAQAFLCEAAWDLASGEDILSWDYAMGQVNGTFLEQYPFGSDLALYSDLNDIYADFKKGCLCEATASLAVIFAKKRYCPR